MEGKRKQKATRQHVLKTFGELSSSTKAVCGVASSQDGYILATL